MSERYPETVDEEVGAVIALSLAVEGLVIRFGFKALLSDIYTVVQVNADRAGQLTPAELAVWERVETALRPVVALLEDPAVANATTAYEQLVREVEESRTAPRTTRG